MQFWAGEGGREGFPVFSVKEAFKRHTIVFSRFRKVIHMFSTAEGLLTQEDKVTADGLQEVFETNVFGHFILVKGLGSRSSYQCQNPKGWRGHVPGLFVKLINLWLA